MEMLKSCIADQLRTIEANEARAVDRVRKTKHVLRKGAGINKIEYMKRARSSPALRTSQVRRARSFTMSRCCGCETFGQQNDDYKQLTQQSPEADKL